MHGARIVAEVVGNETMFEEWNEEMQMMAGRIKVVAGVGAPVFLGSGTHAVVPLPLSNLFTHPPILHRL